MSVRKPWRLRLREAISRQRRYMRDNSLIHGITSCEGAQGIIVRFHLHGGCHLKASSIASCWSGDVTGARCSLSLARWKSCPVRCDATWDLAGHLIGRRSAACLARWEV